MQLVADGQLASSATALYTGIAQVQAVVVCQNTSASLTETVAITLTKLGGTARRVAYAVLAPNEQLVVTGLPLNVSDVVKGSATDATTVDYTVSTTSTDIPYSIQSLDANGAVKQVNTGIAGNQTASGALKSTSSTGGVGYGTGAGGAVTQLTDRSTGVTLNTVCGSITTNTASLATGAEATFTVTNSAVAATDAVVVSLKTPSSTGLSVPFVTTTAAGSFQITLSNLHGSTADTSASVINFSVIKSVAS